MASTAIAAQGAKLRVSSASGSAITITAATKANPCVLTAVNTLAAGDIITISGVVGMTQLNGRAFVVASATGTSITLKGIDSTGYSTYTSGGAAAKQTMADVGNVMGFSGFNGQASEIDVTNLDSLAKEFRLGLQDFGTADLDIALDTSDAGQAVMLTNKNAGSQAAFSLTLSNGQVAAFYAYVKSFSADVAPDGVVKGKSTLRITGLPSFFV